MYISECNKQKNNKNFLKVLKFVGVLKEIKFFKKIQMQNFFPYSFILHVYEH